MKKIIKSGRRRSPVIIICIFLLAFSLLQLTNLVVFAASGLASPTAPIKLNPICKEDSKIGTPTRIQISKSNIDLSVMEVPLKDGAWEVHEGMANHAKETGLISKTGGNVGIYAHDKQNGFTNIKKLVAGDEVTVYTASGQKATYVVSSISVAESTSVNTFYPTSAPTLTLVTCDGAFSEQRYIVKAKLKSLSKGICVN